MFLIVRFPSCSSSVTLHSRCSLTNSRAKKFRTAFCPSNCSLPCASGPENPPALQTGQRRALGAEIASGIARRHFRIRQPDGFLGRGDADGHDARPVGALEQGAELRQAAFEFQQKARRLRFEREVFQLEIRFRAARQ